MYRAPIRYWLKRDGKIIHRGSTHNNFTAQGATHLLGVRFALVTALNSWNLGLISGDNFTALDRSDLLDNHSGWEEFKDYSVLPTDSEIIRHSFAGIHPTDPTINNNAGPRHFKILCKGSIKGVLVTDEFTKSSNTGVLMATAVFPEKVCVFRHDELFVEYYITLEEDA